MKVKGKHVILSFVCLVLGFLISFSYQYTKRQMAEGSMSDSQWEKEYSYRKMLIKEEEKTRSLQHELFAKQEKVRANEERLAGEEDSYSELVKDVERLRMFTGEVAVKGPGVEVVLDDASYIPSDENVNNYIVHESHVFKVINELYISGASSVAVNGKRISRKSYIYCNGPVITVDGEQFPNPFVITAIGDPNVLYPALNMAGGVETQLVNDNVVVKITKKDEIVMDPILPKLES